VSEWKPVPGEAVFWTFKDRIEGNPPAKGGIFCIHGISAGLYIFPLELVEMKPYNCEKAKNFPNWSEL
jgi:hypothetical protein